MSKKEVRIEQFQYSKALSSLFCSVSILALSGLCLLNSLALDFYTMIVLLKVVIPASFCFWFLGFVIGKILDSLVIEKDEETRQEVQEDDKAYEIPSMFNAQDEAQDDISVMEIL
jgi:hypothetical protein